jgi:ATP-dependent Clp protease adaptor protein ClpS
VSNHHNDDGKYDPGSVVDGEAETYEPKMYQVILHNDHYTTMDFVVSVLMKIFHKSAAEATKIMLDVHKKGKGICGVYICDIAMTKVAQVAKMAKEHEYPLRCSYEEV